MSQAKVEVQAGQALSRAQLRGAYDCDAEFELCEARIRALEYRMLLIDDDVLEPSHTASATHAELEAIGVLAARTARGCVVKARCLLAELEAGDSGYGKLIARTLVQDLERLSAIDALRFAAAEEHRDAND